MAYSRFATPFYSTFTTVPTPSPSHSVSHDHTPPSPNPYLSSPSYYIHPYSQPHPAPPYSHAHQPPLPYSQPQPPPPYSPTPCFSHDYTPPLPNQYTSSSNPYTPLASLYSQSQPPPYSGYYNHIHPYSQSVSIATSITNSVSGSFSHPQSVSLPSLPPSKTAFLPHSVDTNTFPFQLTSPQKPDSESFVPTTPIEVPSLSEEVLEPLAMAETPSEVQGTPPKEDEPLAYIGIEVTPFQERGRSFRTTTGDTKSGNPTPTRPPPKRSESETWRNVSSTVTTSTFFNWRVAIPPLEPPDTDPFPSPPSKPPDPHFPIISPPPFQSISLKEPIEHQSPLNSEPFMKAEGHLHRLLVLSPEPPDKFLVPSPAPPKPPDPVSVSFSPSPPSVPFSFCCARSPPLDSQRTHSGSSVPSSEPQSRDPTIIPCGFPTGSVISAQKHSQPSDQHLNFKDQSQPFSKSTIHVKLLQPITVSHVSPHLLQNSSEKLAPAVQRFFSQASHAFFGTRCTRSVAKNLGQCTFNYPIAIHVIPALPIYCPSLHSAIQASPFYMLQAIGPKFPLSYVFYGPNNSLEKPLGFLHEAYNYERYTEFQIDVLDFGLSANHYASSMHSIIEKSDGTFSFLDTEVVLFKQWDPGKIILWVVFFFFYKR